MWVETGSRANYWLLLLKKKETTTRGSTQLTTSLAENFISEQSMHNSSSSDSDSSDPLDPENETIRRLNELFPPLLGKRKRDCPLRKKTITQGRTQLTTSSAENFISE